MADGVRTAELIASLSLATDLGLGQPEEHVLRQTLIATRLARIVGLSEAEQGAVFHLSLLAWVGCVADSHELATWFGDDRQMRADSYAIDKAGASMMRFMLAHLAAGSAPLRRVTVVGRFLAGGFRDAMNSFLTHCQTTADVAERLGLSDDVRRGLPQAFERWDGKGLPRRLAGNEILPTMRIVQIADDAEVYHRLGGSPAVVEMLTARRGTEFDPAYVDVCCREVEAVFGNLASIDAWASLVDSVPGLDQRIPDSDLTRVLEIFADYADLKSPWFTGHSRAVARLATEAARRAGCGADEVTLIERAALVSRVGVIGVSTGVWDKRGPLSQAEWERVRTVPYLSERIMRRQPVLARIGELAGLVHERMDGSGYPRGLGGASIPLGARLLAVAEAYQAMSEDRPHRPARTPARREAVLHSEVDAGRLDSSAVRAVLDAAGHRTARRTRQVAGLTGREVEVLALVVRGHSNKQIAAQLSISQRTVGSHVEHIYAKIGVSTRGAAAMYAMRHGLVDPGRASNIG